MGARRHWGTWQWVASVSCTFFALRQGRCALMSSLPVSQFEGPTLAGAIKAAVTKVGAKEFGVMLFNVGLYYHLYNQARAFGQPQRSMRICYI